MSFCRKCLNCDLSINSWFLGSYNSFNNSVKPSQSAFWSSFWNRIKDCNTGPFTYVVASFNFSIESVTFRQLKALFKTKSHSSSLSPVLFEKIGVLESSLTILLFINSDLSDLIKFWFVFSDCGVKSITCSGSTWS